MLFAKFSGGIFPMKGTRQTIILVVIGSHSFSTMHKIERTKRDRALSIHVNQDFWYYVRDVCISDICAFHCDNNST